MAGHPTSGPVGSDPLLDATSPSAWHDVGQRMVRQPNNQRSEEHTSELQSHVNLVCRLLPETKKSSPSTAMSSASTRWRWISDGPFVLRRLAGRGTSG